MHSSTWMPHLSSASKFLKFGPPWFSSRVIPLHSSQTDDLLQIAAVAALCVQPEPSYRPLIADVVQSLVPLVPHELGGALRDHKASVPVDNNKLKNLEICDDYYLTDPDEQSYSKRSDYSFISLEEPISKSSDLGIDIHDQFWKPQWHWSAPLKFLIHILERPLGDKLKTILSNAFMLLHFTRWSVPEATTISAHDVLMKSVFRFIDPSIHELHEKVHITQPQFFSHSSKSFCRFVKTSIPCAMS